MTTLPWGATPMLAQPTFSGAAGFVMGEGLRGYQAAFLMAG